MLCSNILYSLNLDIHLNIKVKNDRTHILHNNLSYNVLTNNCLHASIYYLKYGTLNKNNNDFQKALNKTYIIPNNAINSFKKFGVWAEL